MSLVLNFTASVPTNAETLKITDITGTYSALCTGGWGTPNPAIDTALTATVGVSKRQTNGIFETETLADVYSTLPSAIGGYVEINADDAGQGDTFADGIYRLRYSVTGDDGGTPYNPTTKTIYKVFTPTLDAYRMNLAKDVSACNCSCESLVDKFNCFSTYYDLLCVAKGCGDLNGAQKYIDILTVMMNNNRCNC